MPLSPSSSVQEARQAIARRLREARLDAGLTGRALAERCGWHPAKTSRLEHARAAPSDEDIRSWCAACDAPELIPDLLAASRSADSMYVEWKRLHRSGMRRAQEDLVPLFERTRHFRVYCSTVVPGLVQTPEYATALLATISDFQGTPDDSAEAAQARVERSRVIREGRHRFAILVEEDVLYRNHGGPDVMAGQLGYLLSVMALPSVSLGVIPRGTPRRMWTIEAFHLFDEHRVQIELLTAKVTITQPSEVQTYAKAFGRLTKMAVHGAEARQRIVAALDSVG
ncbi:helix-turn-helix domain-containing protein [Streptomyces albus]|uniref:XRE family transcriptional regulator n=1 Tax=Streptomyces albus TaxID=1888 RepID=A0A6C1C1L7_9ACTN|nr:helix-turn-helix transcriptional regulator [Streptomyces albus]KPC87318.1 XRE family transcriptional regulator [Streptomyces sp. NRRL F-6602]QID36061.1 helix-turn-helix domain-containing protein [Streptomyces albus]TGG89435.1 XRE family transcriptional regulator [Streptomyces albus]UVN57137.1 helix-turn-helix transcriptional regulator [Streptomyces albus]